MNNQIGRSMIEMLGVLAVVGTLSVGGIKAYQNIMRKHHLNKLAEEHIAFIQNMLLYEKDFINQKKRSSPNETLYLSPYLKNIGIIPHKWRMVSTSQIQDSAGIIFDPHIYDRSNNTFYHNRLRWNYILKTVSTKIAPQELCLSMYTKVLLPSHAVIRNMSYYVDENEGDDKTLTEFGDNFCDGKTKKCINNLTAADILERCSLCNEKSKRCLLIVSF